MMRSSIATTSTSSATCPDVWLSGSVDSFAAWRRAELATRDTPGVGAVHNGIRILVPRLESP